MALEWEYRKSIWSDIQYHMDFLRETAESRQAPVVFEFGVRTGNSTICFLAGTENNGGQVWSVDVSPADVPGEWHGIDRWHFLQGDDVSPQIADALPAECDVLFIDTYHQFEHTLQELRTYVPRVRTGGVVLMHDTEWEQTGDTPDDCRQLDSPGGSVTAALDAFCAETGLAWENRAGSYGIGIIRI